MCSPRPQLPVGCPAYGPGATVYFETAQSLIQHGFRRILFQQETKAIAVNLNDAVETMRGAVLSQVAPTAQAFDRRSGVGRDVKVSGSRSGREPVTQDCRLSLPLTCRTASMLVCNSPASLMTG